MWPCSAWRSPRLYRASIRSSLVSPMPINKPLVKGTAASPAARIAPSLVLGSYKRLSNPCQTFSVSQWASGKLQIAKGNAKCSRVDIPLTTVGRLNGFTCDREKGQSFLPVLGGNSHFVWAVEVGHPWLHQSLAGCLQHQPLTAYTAHDTRGPKKRRASTAVGGGWKPCEQAASWAEHSSCGSTKAR